jgi:response regulator RpfG family c-di-GMP phosphodiesterase/DNA-binding CsgD family transcriptional regulator
MESSRYRLAETLGAVSLATDLAAGSAPETALGATVASVRIGRMLGLSPSDLSDVYYGSLLRFIGCTATATEVAALALGADQPANYAVSMCDWVDPDQVEASMDTYLPRDVAETRRREALAAVRANHEGIPGLIAVHCAQALAFAGRLPLPAGVPELLRHMTTRWDGQFSEAAGSDIPIGARVILLAVNCEHHRRAGGTLSAVEVARARAGGQFDPELCALVEGEAAVIFDGFDALSVWPLFLESEPNGTRLVEPGTGGAVAGVLADFADQKSGWWLGHSHRVASLASTAAASLDLDRDELAELQIAALVHDIGRAAVANGVWEKPGALGPIERRLVEGHSYQTESVLSLSSLFEPIAVLASSAYERGDGSGFHRHNRVTDTRAGLLAAADVYDALTHDRPWRDALQGEAAADEVRAMVSDGLLLPDCARAVLEAAGHRRRASEQVYPAGLTRREVEVLSLLARGAQTKVIAARLSISAKTADHHIQSVYEKTGARGRAAAALFAVQQGLLQN